MSDNEKIYRTMNTCGLISIISGVVMIVFAVTAGIMVIVSGAKLVVDKKGLTI